MITENDIIEILNEYELDEDKVLAVNCRDIIISRKQVKKITKAITDKIKENSYFLKGNAFKFIAQNKKFEQIEFIQTTISPKEKSISICISESRKNKKYQKRN